MKKTIGIIVSLVIIIVLVIAGTSMYKKGNTSAVWKTYSNSKYGYSIQYPSNWSINTQYSDSDFTPRGPAPYTYIGGNTSLSNYSPSYIEEFQKQNGDLAAPADLTYVNISFTKVPATKSMEDAVKGLGISVAGEVPVTLNGISGIKITTLNSKDIGGLTKANSVGIWLKKGDELVNIGYGFDSNNASEVTTADKIIDSFILQP